MNELAKIDSFRRDLALAETIEQFKLLGDSVKAFQFILQRQGANKLIIDEVGELDIEVECGKGEWLDMFYPHGVNSEYRKTGVAKTETPKMPVSPKESAKAKKINKFKKSKPDVFNKMKDKIKKDKNTILNVKSLSKEIDKEVKQKDREEKADAGKNITLDIDFRLGDFEEVLSDIPDGSIDCIITDPPYPLEFIECWSKLSRFAAKKLKPNGFCIAYSGQYNLPEVINRMNENLTYYWTFAVYHEGLTQIVNAVNIICRWKPVLIYQNGRRKLENTFQDYFISEKREKHGHDWQQSVSGVSYLIEMFTKPGDLIIDPFAGSGTTIIAAKKLNRNIIAAEINEDTYNIAKACINDITEI